jgi:hypothetical protein
MRAVSLATATGLIFLLAISPAGAEEPIPDGPPAGMWDPGAFTHKTPSKSPNTTIIERGGKGGIPTVRFVALLTGDGQQIDQGLVWRIFQMANRNGKTKLLVESHDASPSLRLKPGEYTVNAAFGRANLTRKIVVKPNGPPFEPFILNAGGLRVTALVNGKPAPPGAVTYSIYTDDRDQLDSRSTVIGAPSPISSSGSIRASIALSRNTATPTPGSRPMPRSRQAS